MIHQDRQNTVRATVSRDRFFLVELVWHESATNTTTVLVCRVFGLDKECPNALHNSKGRDQRDIRK